MPETVGFDWVTPASELWGLIRDGKCVAWIGSGLSKPLYPSLDSLLPKLCQECGVARPDASRPFEDVAEECKCANGDAYRNLLSQVYGLNTTQIRQAYPMLISLPFAGYVTTNFDPLLCQAANLHGAVTVHKYPDLPIHELSGNRRPAYYIHGCVEHPGDREARSLVLAASDFREAYAGYAGSVVGEVLTYYKVVFFGCLLREQLVGDLFRQVDNVNKTLQELDRGRPLPERLIFLPETGADTGSSAQEREEELRCARSERARITELGIKVLTYPPVDDHLLLDQILRHTVKLRDEAARMPKEADIPSLW